MSDSTWSSMFPGIPSSGSAVKALTSGATSGAATDGADGPSLADLKDPLKPRTAAEQQMYDQNAKKVLDTVAPTLIGGAVGGVAGGVAGALLWKKHRFLGFLLGSMFVGAPVGSAVGLAIFAERVKKL